MYALYQNRSTPITFIDLDLEKLPLKTAISQSNFFKFDDVPVTLLRTELGVLIDNLTRVYSVVNRKVAAKPIVTEETTNSKVIKENESTVL